MPCGAVEDRRVETVALARARAVPGDKPLETCDNDEKETTTTFTGGSPITLASLRVARDYPLTHIYRGDSVYPYIKAVHSISI